MQKRVTMSPNIPLPQVPYRLKSPHPAPQPSLPRRGQATDARLAAPTQNVASLEDVTLELGLKAAGVAWSREHGCFPHTGFENS